MVMSRQEVAEALRPYMLISAGALTLGIDGEGENHLSGNTSLSAFGEVHCD
jgi:hypothetical protein